MNRIYMPAPFEIPAIICGHGLIVGKDVQANQKMPMGKMMASHKHGYIVRTPVSHTKGPQMSHMYSPVFGRDKVALIEVALDSGKSVPNDAGGAAGYADSD